MTGVGPEPITASTRVVGVVGWPVQHSLSPAIHNAALRAGGLDFVYVAFPVPPERLETTVRGLAAAGCVGLNCTVPHKHAAMAVCDDVSDVARAVGAVNTIHFRPDAIHGTNTDVEGYVETLRHEGGFEFTDRAVVQIGAGGAGRAMALGALSAGAARLSLVNRTVEKAEAMVDELGRLYPNAAITALSPTRDPSDVESALGEADLVANATSLGLDEGDPLPCAVEAIRPEAVVLDAAYTARRSTAWLRAASERGCRTVDGLGMLVRQAVAGFRMWTGAEPDLAAMFAALPPSDD